MTKLSQTRYGVRGLTCNRCLVSALEAVRALPGLRRVAMSLVPSGESLLTVTPSDVATGSELRALLGSVGFELTLRRNAQPASSDQAPERATSASALPPLTAHERTVPMTHHPHTDTTPHHSHPTGSDEAGRPPSRHRGHYWHMLLMCVPLVALGLWSLTRGAGAGTLMVGILCMGMMLFMHRMPGTGHRH